MSEARAAFQGTYADLKFIKTRKVAAITIEIPQEMAQAFVAAFGTPDPASEIPVAIARLDLSQKPEPEPKALPAPERRAWSDLRPSQQAGIRCGEVAFQKFLKERRTLAWGNASFDDANDTDAKRAAECVRDICRVGSRSELDRKETAGAIWSELCTHFDVWMGRAG
jgi:hypothetical protein